jgi:hypothetical protein
VAKSIAIGMPLVEMMFSRFFEGFLELEGVQDCPRKLVIGNVIAAAYEQIARWFVEETTCDYLLTLEQDHRFPRNLLARVANYEDPIVGALYYTRHEPHQPVPGVPYPEDWNRPEVWAGDWSGIRATPLWPSLERDWRQEGGLNRVLFTGLGCTAIRRDVLEDWPKDRPYFADDWWPELGVHRSCDVRFCHEAAKLGHFTYLDCGLVLPHMTVREVTAETYWTGLRKRARELGLSPV